MLTIFFFFALLFIQDCDVYTVVPMLFEKGECNGRPCGTSCNQESGFKNGICNGKGFCVDSVLNPCTQYGCRGKLCGEECLSGDIMGFCNLKGNCETIHLYKARNSCGVQATSVPLTSVSTMDISATKLPRTTDHINTVSDTTVTVKEERCGSKDSSFRLLMQNKGYSDKEIDEIDTEERRESKFKIHDKDDDGKLSYEEWLECQKGIVDTFSPDYSEDIIGWVFKLFMVYDENKDGEISFKEVLDTRCAVYLFLNKNKYYSQNTIQHSPSSLSSISWASSEAINSTPSAITLAPLPSHITPADISSRITTPADKIPIISKVTCDSNIDCCIFVESKPIEHKVISQEKCTTVEHEVCDNVTETKVKIMHKKDCQNVAKKECNTKANTNCIKNYEELCKYLPEMLAVQTPTRKCHKVPVKECNIVESTDPSYHKKSKKVCQTCKTAPLIKNNIIYVKSTKQFCTQVNERKCRIKLDTSVTPETTTNCKTRNACKTIYNSEYRKECKIVYENICEEKENKEYKEKCINYTSAPKQECKQIAVQVPYEKCTSVQECKLVPSSKSEQNIRENCFNIPVIKCTPITADNPRRVLAKEIKKYCVGEFIHQPTSEKDSPS